MTVHNIILFFSASVAPEPENVVTPSDKPSTKPEEAHEEKHESEESEYSEHPIEREF